MSIINSDRDNCIRIIRDFEAECSLKPTDISNNNDGSLTVVVDALTLYQTVDPSTLSRGRQFWNWLNGRDISFDCKRHAECLMTELNAGCVDARLNVAKISVRKRYVQLPIPFLNIPVWPFERSGTKVRDFTNLATQPVKISLTFSPEQCKDPLKIVKTIAQASIASRAQLEAPALPTAAKQHTFSPITWLFHFLSLLIPRFISRQINKILPNKLIKGLGRVSEWGTNFAEFEIDTPSCNSGLIASSWNCILHPLMFTSTCGDMSRSGPTSWEFARKDPPNADNRHNATKWINDISYTWGENNSPRNGGNIPYSGLYNSRVSLNLATRARLVHIKHVDVNDLQLNKNENRITVNRQENQADLPWSVRPPV